MRKPTDSPMNSKAVDFQYVKGIEFDSGKEVMIIDFERVFHAC